MAENGESLCRGVASYIERALQISTEYAVAVTWQERERLFDAGEIEILWLCGLPYVQKADSMDPRMEILAVPVPAGARYSARPVYFSDVIVRRESCFRAFADLRGASWAYNEPRSHSGFNVVRTYLAERRQYSGFFGTVYQSGAHSASIEMVVSGDVEAAAIDSTVLEWSTVNNRRLLHELRVIHTFGPSPIPPWVISKRVPRRLRAQVRAVLLGMDSHPAGRCVLEEGRIARFVRARDCDYDPIRRMAALADAVTLGRALASV
jgi:phosphonate transport system substrate-binding protein